MRGNENILDWIWIGIEREMGGFETLDFVTYLTIQTNILFSRGKMFYDVFSLVRIIE
jgi:hypothetical protein